jgi:hypothetical protein
LKLIRGTFDPNGELKQLGDDESAGLLFNVGPFCNRVLWTTLETRASLTLNTESGAAFFLRGAPVLAMPGVSKSVTSVPVAVTFPLPLLCHALLIFVLLANSFIFHTSLAATRPVVIPNGRAFVYSCHYLRNEGVTIDPKLAFKFCRTAAEGGHTASQCTLAGLYSRGDGVERDERKATTWLLRAAKEGGDADAQFYTALRYKSGNGHDAPNMKEAAKWYQAAVAQGHAAAHLELGNLYHGGDGVESNPRLALKLWRKCVQHFEKGAALKQELKKVSIP